MRLLKSSACCAFAKTKKRQKGVLARFFAAFNRMFDRFTNGYVKVASFFARKLIITLIILGGIVVATVMLGKRIPAGFVPEEDQGYFIISTLLPDAASLERTDGLQKKLRPSSKAFLR
jgi:HAE1 family hydrophobic/amphiphilic exporter-1